MQAHDDMLDYSDTITVTGTDAPRGLWWARGTRFPFRILVHVVCVRASGMQTIAEGDVLKADIVWREKGAQAWRLAR